MKLKIFASDVWEDLDKVVQAINAEAKSQHTTYQILSSNKPNYIVDPVAGIMQDTTNSKHKIHFEKSTKVASVIKDVCNGNEKLVKDCVSKLRSQYSRIVSQRSI